MGNKMVSVYHFINKAKVMRLFLLLLLCFVHFHALYIAKLNQLGTGRKYWTPTQCRSTAVQPTMLAV